jgi:hypothetical protein
MKSTNVLIIILIGMVFVCGCKKREEGRYYNRDKGFSIKVPAGWDIEEKKMNTDIIAVSPAEGPDDTFRENFNVLVEELERSLSTDEYYQKGIPLFKQFATDFAQHGTGTERIDGVDFRYDIISHKMGPLTIKVLQYLAVKRKKGYLITFSASNDKFPLYEAMFKEIAKGFRFE